METISRLKPYNTPPFTPIRSFSSHSRNRLPFNCTMIISFTFAEFYVGKSVACPQSEFRFPFGLGFTRNQFDQNFRLHGLIHSNPSRVQHKLRRNTVVKSELTMSGSPNAGYSATEFQLGPRIRGICFYTVSATAAIFLFIAMVAAHPFVILFDRNRRRIHHLIAKLWASMTIAPFCKLEFEGLENLPSSDAPAVYVSNHRSFLDVYTLLTLGRSFKFISKRGIFVIPIIGWAMFLMGVIPLRRMDNKSHLDCLKHCMDLVKKGASVFFFPEGTRSKDGKLGMFKKGAFSVAAKTGAPVVPITLLGTGELMPAGMEGILNSNSVKVVVHKPIEGKDAEMLCKQARDVIADTCLLHGYGVQNI